MNLVTAVGAAAFVAAALFYLYFGSVQVNFPNPSFYSVQLQEGGRADQSVQSFDSLLAGYFFVFVSGLFAYGWTGVLAMAAEGAKNASLFLTQKLSPTEFFFGFPQLLALASSSVLCQSTLLKGGERRKKQILAAALFLIGIMFLAALAYARRFF